MFTDAEIAEFRADALDRMTSRVTVMRKTGDTTEVDGYKVPEWAAVHVDLPFRLASYAAGGGHTSTVTIGGVQFQDATARGDMPHDTYDLADDDLVLLTAGEWTDSVFRIIEAVKGDQKTARRVPIVETPRPKEWA